MAPLAGKNVRFRQNAAAVYVYDGDTIKVRFEKGLLESYKGRPEIFLFSPRQVKALNTYKRVAPFPFGLPWSTF